MGKNIFAIIIENFALLVFSITNNETNGEAMIPRVAMFLK